ncbi:MAG TPA: response regulator transcription factor [Roseiarcus sp.]|nr:response regulator transcription factor [Roseiarcus sp.]
MRLLIVDDHPVVVTGCRAIFAGRDEVETFDVQGGEAGVAVFFDLPADMAMIDINLPAVSGFEVIRRILAREPEARLIAFSMNADPSIAARAIELGARAFLTKSDPPERFLEAVDALTAGDTYLTPGMAREIAFLHGRGQGALTARENDILRRLASGLSLADIAADLGVSYKTIATNCAVLKTKLGARTTQDLVRLAVEKSRM